MSQHDQQQEQVIIIPNSTFVPDTTVAALQRQPSASVVMATNTTSACLAFKPSGAVRPRSAGLRHFLSNLTVFPVVPAPAMHALFRSQLLPRVAQPPAWCVAAASPSSGPAFGVLCRFTTIEEEDAVTGQGNSEQQPAQHQHKRTSRLVGIVINLNAKPLAIAVMTRSRHHSDGLVAETAIELRSGATVRLGSEGQWMQGGQVLVLQLHGGK